MLTPFVTALVVGNCMAGLWLAAGPRFVLTIAGAWQLRSPVVKHPRLHNQSFETDDAGQPSFASAQRLGDACFGGGGL